MARLVVLLNPFGSISPETERDIIQVILFDGSKAKGALSLLHP